MTTPTELLRGLVDLDNQMIMQCVHHAVPNRIVDTEYWPTVADVRDAVIDAFREIAPNIPIELLLSSEKNHKIIGATVEQCRRGLFTLRAYFADKIQQVYRKRIGYATSYYATSYGKVYDLTGLVIVNDVLQGWELDRVSSDIERISIPSVSKRVSSLADNYQYTRRHIIDSSMIRSIISDCYGRSINTADESAIMDMFKRNAFIQRVENRPDDNDVQKVCHSDTFFPALKWWYFPQAVNNDQGPFTYCVNSNILTRKRLEFIHAQSIAISQGRVEDFRTYGHAEGSYRATADELAAMGVKPTRVAVPANTLVVANVFGFHNRSSVSDPHVRNAIHGSIRTPNPFD